MIIANEVGADDVVECNDVNYRNNEVDDNNNNNNNKYYL